MTDIARFMGRGLLACDWGTTNLRAWVLDAAGGVMRHKTFPLGVAKLSPGEAAARFRTEIRPAMEAEALPALLCGMIGSDLGWTAVPHRDCPAALPDLAEALFEVEPERAWIVPGLKCAGVAASPDLMRGEETQIFGWIALERNRQRGSHHICHPGTHAKWVCVEEGRITHFITAMTGELFDLLRSQGVLRNPLPADDEVSFDQGCAAAEDGNALAARLFTARARFVAGAHPPCSAASYLSGLLIGAEIASVPQLIGMTLRAPLTLIGEPELCRWYRRALARKGVAAAVCDAEQAALAGFRALEAIHAS